MTEVSLSLCFLNVVSTAAIALYEMFHSFDSRSQPGRIALDWEHPVFVYVSYLSGKGEAFGLQIYRLKAEIYRPNAVAPTV